MSEAGVSVSYSQRLTLATVALTNAFPTTLSFTVLAILVQRAGGSALAVSMVVTVHFVGVLFFAPVWGAVADITGRRRGVLLATTGLSTVALLLLGLATSVVGYVGLRGVYAVFFAAFPPIMLTIVSEHGDGGDSGHLFGEFNSFRSVGFALGQVFAGILLVNVTSFGIFLVLAVVNFLTFVGVLYVEDPSPIEETTQTLSGLVSTVKTRLVPTVGDAEPFWASGLLYLYVGTVLQGMTFFGMFSLLPVYFVSGIGIAEVVVGVFLAINPAGRALFMYVCGYFSKATAHKAMILIGLLGTGLSTLTMAAATLPNTLLYRQAMTIFSLLAMAFALSSFTIGSLEFISVVAPLERESELMGLRDTARGIGGLLGPVILGGIVNLLNFEIGFLVWTLLPIVGLGIVVVGVTRQQR